MANNGVQRGQRGAPNKWKLIISHLRPLFSIDSFVRFHLCFERETNRVEREREARDDLWISRAAHRVQRALISDVSVSCQVNLRYFKTNWTRCSRRPVCRESRTGSSFFSANETSSFHRNRFQAEGQPLVEANSSASSMTRPVTLIGSTERGRLVELLRLRRNGRDSGLRECREPYRDYRVALTYFIWYSRNSLGQA